MTSAIRSRPATLRPDDEKRIAAVETGLKAACKSAKDATAAVRRFTDAVDRNRDSAIVLETIEDNDSLVVHVADSLQAVSRAQRRSRP